MKVLYFFTIYNIAVCRLGFSGQEVKQQEGNEM